MSSKIEYYLSDMPRSYKSSYELYYYCLPQYYAAHLSYNNQIPKCRGSNTSLNPWTGIALLRVGDCGFT